MVPNVGSLDIRLVKIGMSLGITINGIMGCVCGECTLMSYQVLKLLVLQYGYRI